MKFYNKIGNTWIEWSAEDLDGDWFTPTIIAIAVVIIGFIAVGLYCRLLLWLFPS